MATQSMAKMKDLKNLSASELVVKARGLEADLFQNRMKKVTGQMMDTATLWRMRKDLARVKTLQSQAKSKAKGK